MKIRSHHPFVLSIVFALGVFVFTVPAHAQARNPDWMIVGGISGRPDYEGSDTAEAFPFGAFQARWASGRYVELTGARSSGSAARLAVNLLDSERFEVLELGPVLQYRVERDDVDSNRVEALGKIDAAVELGAFVALNLDPVKISATGAGDVSNSYDGGMIELAADWKAKLSNAWQLTSGIASTWAGDEYMQTYFGVSAGGALASGLPQFGASSGFKDVGLRFTTMWAGPRGEWKHFRLMGMLSFFKMLGDADDSPVVDIEGDDKQIFGGVGIAWQS
jgi:outer membrane protein